MRVLLTVLYLNLPITAAVAHLGGPTPHTARVVIMQAQPPGAELQLWIADAPQHVIRDAQPPQVGVAVGRRRIVVEVTHEGRTKIITRTLTGAQ